MSVLARGKPTMMSKKFYSMLLGGTLTMMVVSIMLMADRLQLLPLPHHLYRRAQRLYQRAVRAGILDPGLRRHPDPGVSTSL